ncbi:hypothetical protein BWI96_05095 [Siphonobacter sp. SORGH_AS_0500]|uniref:2'-5' RNA ligase family protein n=1 Tax=Siphonobacter sp. SORGH_AS_0500 TaxID=1864824 RepID=UPI000CA6E7EC|nr:2'-5' RNA ligase family protein [Siphonobacter sp. SORGH_AS_0500]PKK37838.1 hypothetical protein BWI96_05095 [Siphonobacter sp. SORGH_AS_0500]
MNSEPVRYLLAALPPEDLAQQVWFYKRHVAETCGSVRGMRVLPHITYIPPFTLPEQDVTMVEQGLAGLIQSFQAESVRLEGFGYFSGKKSHVIYVAVEKTELMQQQYTELMAYAVENSLLSESQLRPSFTPHLTIAYRDLSEEKFQLTWPYFKDRPFSETMLLNHLWLLKHEGKNWEPMTRFDFRG